MYYMFLFKCHQPNIIIRLITILHMALDWATITHHKNEMSTSSGIPFLIFNGSDDNVLGSLDIRVQRINQWNKRKLKSDDSTIQFYVNRVKNQHIYYSKNVKPSFTILNVKCRYHALDTFVSVTKLLPFPTLRLRRHLSHAMDMFYVRWAKKTIFFNAIDLYLLIGSPSFLACGALHWDSHPKNQSV